MKEETNDVEARNRKLSEAADTTADVSLSETIEVKEETVEKKKKKKKDKSKDEAEDQNGDQGSPEVSFYLLLSVIMVLNDYSSKVVD